MKEFIILGGANGSGKSTFSKPLLESKKYVFLNADDITKELGSVNDYSRIAAGKELFSRLNAAIEKNENIVLESTLSGKYIGELIKTVKSKGYNTFLVYIFLKDPNECIERIKDRVNKNGHSVPDEDVIRRFYRSKVNFWESYKNIVDQWLLYYNGETAQSEVAIGEKEDYFIKHAEHFDLFFEQTNIIKNAGK